MNHLRAAAATTGWGIYCACSWTWCIGMFLPVLLLDRFGWPGFIVFAVPNVLGCAAFGYLANPDRIARIRRRGAWILRAFSLVTIGYHVFFAGLATDWLLGGGGGWRVAAVGAAGGLLVLGWFVSRLPLRAWPWLAGVVYALSLAVFATVGAAPLRSIAWDGNDPAWWLWAMAPTIAFGFLLCPYLDLTFHRARQSAPSRHAFAVFGITFAVMIVLTCAYAALPAGAARVAVAAHLAVQAIFTVTAHWRELDAADAPPASRRSHWTGPALVAAAVVAAALGLLALPAAKDMYIRWLVFYGLLFPAAVLFLVRPWSGPARPPVGGLPFAVGMVVLAPLYELGFLWDRPWILPITLASILLAAGRTAGARTGA
ncbi:MAG: hypothetical protein KDA22_05700 [Phycisphaerales bacterium]|nr:hypothetical protein [Phycisphaerales bacterium]